MDAHTNYLALKKQGWVNMCTWMYALDGQCMYGKEKVYPRPLHVIQGPTLGRGKYTTRHQRGTKYLLYYLRESTDTTSQMLSAKTERQSLPLGFYLKTLVF